MAERHAHPWRLLKETVWAYGEHELCECRDPAAPQLSASLRCVLDKDALAKTETLASYRGFLYAFKVAPDQAPYAEKITSLSCGVLTM